MTVIQASKMIIKLLPDFVIHKLHLIIIIEMCSQAPGRYSTGYFDLVPAIHGRKTPIFESIDYEVPIV